MSKSQNKTKLKTLPNQMTTTQQQFCLVTENQAQNRKKEAHPHNFSYDGYAENLYPGYGIDGNHGNGMHKINLASPTFATYGYPCNDENASVEQEKGDQENNRIRICLKQMKINQNAIQKNTTANKRNSVNKNINNQNDLKAVNEPKNIFQFSKKSDLQFLTGQNQKLVQKCKILSQKNSELEQQNKILGKKLEVLSIGLEKKFNEVSKYMQMQNSSTKYTKVDLYAEVQVIKEDYKMSKIQNQRLLNQNSELLAKLADLQEIITNYTEKSQKKKHQRKQSMEKTKQLQKNFQQKLEELKKRFQQKQKQLENVLKQKEKIIKKQSEEYEKLKFLKQQISKKRNQDLKTSQNLQAQLKEKENQLQVLYLQVQQSKMNQAQNQALQKQRDSYQKQAQLLRSQIDLLQKQCNKSKHNAQAYKNLNQKLTKQLNEQKQKNENKKNLSKIVQQMQQQKQDLKSENKKLKMLESSLNQKIVEVQLRCEASEKQLDKMRRQFSQCLEIGNFNADCMKNDRKKISKGGKIGKNITSLTHRNYPQISKFGSEQQISQRSQKLNTENSQPEHSHQQQHYQDQQNAASSPNSSSSQLKSHIQSLTRKIQSLKKQKQDLENQLANQREKYDKVNLQLQNTYRKIQENGHANGNGYFNTNGLYEREISQRGNVNANKRDKNQTFSITGNVTNLHAQITKTTKIIPQLKMIKQILLKISSQNDSYSRCQTGYLVTNSSISKPLSTILSQKQNSAQSLVCLISEIKFLSEQVADQFDCFEKQMENYSQRIHYKQEIITKLLKFTPEQKKSALLQYLKIMENAEKFTVEDIFHAGKIIQEEASQWKRGIKDLYADFSRVQEDNSALRTQISVLKSKSRQLDDGVIRRYQNYGDRAQNRRQRERDRFQKLDRYERDRGNRYPQKFQSRRY